MSEPFDGLDDNGDSVIEGVSAASDDGHDVSKQPVTSETKVLDQSAA
jgi:hypothetical protein